MVLFGLEGSENTVQATTNKISAHFKYAKEPCWLFSFFKQNNTTLAEQCYRVQLIDTLLQICKFYSFPS